MMPEKFGQGLGMRDFRRVAGLNYKEVKMWRFLLWWLRVLMGKAW